MGEGTLPGAGDTPEDRLTTLLLSPSRTGSCLVAWTASPGKVEELLDASNWSTSQLSWPCVSWCHQGELLALLISEPSWP